jgi:hypothetical protein
MVWAFWRLKFVEAGGGGAMEAVVGGVGQVLWVRTEVVVVVGGRGSDVVAVAVAVTMVAMAGAKALTAMQVGSEDLSMLRASWHGNISVLTFLAFWRCSPLMLFVD